ncbi:iron-sulfur cluster carrier protein MrpORP [Oceanidesulfovibrio marinus]|uniref:Iron-sulfur cluster carrier protein n=1 Tax=Oceanidesulfovibrio marinus TaxID=370038 RepID=A0A6P1ZEL3_9BACT|nr:iron-sulfur cluster carrier protein MrpORP [Oceanidesulfovibrio marinus]QJT11138.1 chromosome partitioning protein ParA [Oceanidesulfovibrio marinus]TVM31692.1 chromosome partitioning protein ParA [Oceanidesulfovibrio marinus]
MSDECTGCGSGGSCDAGGCSGPSQEELQMQARLSRIKNKIVVLSGKGGVGKSTVATNIAIALSMAGKKVGLLDVDVHGPSVPRILGLSGQQPHMNEASMEPVAWSSNLFVMSLGFLLPSPEQAVIWRGPVKMGLINQFLRDVEWGDLDFLVVDCPPGTGDEPLSVLQDLGPEAQAVVVTTPQSIAVDDVRRSVSFVRQLGNPVIGIVENMSGFVCRHCGEVEHIFSSGGGEKLAAEMDVPFLGSIPIDPDMGRAAEEGFSYLKVYEHTAVTEAFGRIIKPILEKAGALQENNTSAPVNGVKRIAVPVADGKLCMHFGHCQQFAFVDIDPDTHEVTGMTLETPPPHEPGVYPDFVSSKGAELVIAGGMGCKAQSLFTDKGVRVLVGATGQDPKEIVRQYLAGDLSLGSNICDH